MLDRRAYDPNAELDEPLVLARSAELIDSLRGFRRQALHAARLVFEHPITGEQIETQAPLPADMRALLDTLARDGGVAAKNTKKS